MYLGTSRIRSAGRTSGSIEMTLPPALQTFTGLACRVVVRDGLQPEIVLQPDFAGSWSALKALWQRLSLALGASEMLDDFTPRSFMLTLLPPRHWPRGLPLAYADLVSLTRSGDGRTEADVEALARIVSVLAAAIGHNQGLEEGLALGFGDAVAYVVTQVPAGFATDFERSMAAGLSRTTHFSPRLPVLPFDDAFWLECEPTLGRVHDQFLAWQANPDQYEAARQQWHRAIQCESVPGCTGQRAAVNER